MLEVSYVIRDGIVLPLSDLRSVLASLSRNQGRWWLEDPLILHQEVSRGAVVELVQVFHSLSGPDQVTDELSFLVPVVGTRHLPDERRMLVCLHPELIRPQVEGLYVEKDRVLADLIADWTRFWEPLKLAAAPSGGLPPSGGSPPSL